MNDDDGDDDGDDNLLGPTRIVSYRDTVSYTISRYDTMRVGPSK